MTQRIEPFSLNMTQRIETFDQEIWLKELNRVSKKDSKNGTLFKRLIELNLFLWTSSQYDSKSWSLSFQYDAKNWTFLVFQYDSKNWTFSKCSRNWTSLPYELLFLHDSNWTLFWWIVSQLSHDAFTCHALPSNCVESKKSRIFHKKWLKVLNTFLNLTERVELFLHWTQRIELFSTIWLKELSPFFFESKIEFFFSKIPSQKMLKELNLFETWLTESNPFETKKTQRIEPSFVFFQWLKELNSL